MHNYRIEYKMVGGETSHADIQQSYKSFLDIVNEFTNAEYHMLAEDGGRRFKIINKRNVLSFEIFEVYPEQRGEDGRRKEEQ